jgi:hypothetical protein
MSDTVKIKGKLTKALLIMNVLTFQIVSNGKVSNEIFQTG